MTKTAVKMDQVQELLLQAFETELGGEKIYETALTCAINDDLKEEWQEYLDETKNHQQILLTVLEEFQIDPDTMTPGRQVTAHIGESLVAAMEMAKKEGDEKAAELVAGECVVLAETKDVSNWKLIGLLGEKLKGKQASTLKNAHEKVMEDEDHHLFHTRGWARELWIESLGLPAVLPPPEEEKSVDTEIGAVRAENAREEFV